LKAAIAMAKLIPIHNKPDPLFSELLQAVTQADGTSMRDTSLFTLRCIITPAGDKISEPLRKSILKELNDLLSADEESTRTTAGSCIGAMLKWLPSAEFDMIMTDVLSCGNEEKDWVVRHGKTTVLTVALKEGPEIVFNEKKRPKVEKAILSMLSSDKVQIVANGIRASTYLILYCMSADELQQALPMAIAQPFAKALNNSSNEVKVLLGNACDVIGRRIHPKILPKDWLKYVIPSLVNGTKEKNSMVRASCECALISLMHLRQAQTAEKACLDALESGAREALSDVISKALRKAVNQSESKEPEIDDTILT